MPRAAIGGGLGGGAASPRLCGCGRAEWRAAFASRIVPAVRAFSPDLILLSAGFGARLVNASCAEPLAADLAAAAPSYRSHRALTPRLPSPCARPDGACNDIGNSKLDAKEKYHQGLDLTAADFEWCQAFDAPNGPLTPRMAP